MRKRVIVFSVLGVLLAISLVSALWPFDSGKDVFLSPPETFAEIVAPGRSIVCTDTDGDLSFEDSLFEKGTAKRTRIRNEKVLREREDRCVTRKKNSVREYYCNAKGRLRSQIVVCENGCADGVCKQPSVEGLENEIRDLQAKLDALIDQLCGLDPGNSLCAGSESEPPPVIVRESFALFGRDKIYYNDSLDKVVQLLIEGNLGGVVLDDGRFPYDSPVGVGVQYKQFISIGSDPHFVYSEQPTIDDDPTSNIKLSTSTDKPIYNLIVQFNKAIDFTSPDSIGKNIKLFGKEFIVGRTSFRNSFVLFEEGKILFLSSSNPSESVTIKGEKYTLELLSASDTSATIKLTVEGNSIIRQINEGRSKELLGVEVGINLADESIALNKISAEVVIGVEKLTFPHDQSVLLGTDEGEVDGTRVIFRGSGLASELTELQIQIAAEDTDNDAILPGKRFVDPVFGTFAIDFVRVAFNEPREKIDVRNVGDDKMRLTMTDHQDFKKTLNWVFTKSGKAVLADSGGDLIHVREMDIVNKSHYAIIGNEDDGYLIEVKTIINSSSGFSSDKVTLRDVFSGRNFDVSITSEGFGTANIGGVAYSVYYRKGANDDGYVRIDDPSTQSFGSGVEMLIYPTIETSLGAKVAFYEPQKFSIDTWDGAGNALFEILFPDGDGTKAFQTSLVGGKTGKSMIFGVQGLKYNIENIGNNKLEIYLLDKKDNKIEMPALIIFEEKNSEGKYGTIVVPVEGKGTSTDGFGVGKITQGFHIGNFDPGFITHSSNNDISSSVDLWGTLMIRDTSESDQASAEILYPGLLKFPSQQIHAEVFVSTIA